MRFFNTAGPVNPEKHYCLPLLARLDLPEVMNLIEQEKYFILHAPRQTGKTSCLLALRDLLNASGRYRAVYFNVEPAQTARGDVAQGIRTVLGAPTAASTFQSSSPPSRSSSAKTPKPGSSASPIRRPGRSF